MKERIFFFDTLRALAMLWIVGIWHLSNYMDKTWEFLKNEKATLITYGMLAVFTFISGWFAANENKYKELNRNNLRVYYMKRFIRVYPLYFVAVFGFYMFNLLSVDQIIPSLFLYFEFTNNAPITIWYIGMIFIFYLITPFICAIKNLRIKWCSCIFINIGGGGIS